jgi:hypothetical protein
MADGEQLRIPGVYGKGSVFVSFSGSFLDSDYQGHLLMKELK